MVMFIGQVLFLNAAPCSAESEQQGNPVTQSCQTPENQSKKIKL